MISRIGRFSVADSRKKHSRISGSALLLLGALFALPLPLMGAEASPFVAGLAPYERPSGAPILTEALPAMTRAKSATHGISEPIPASIAAFLKDQGGWYTPFSWPGMLDYYDLRAWHAAPAPAGKN